MSFDTLQDSEKIRPASLEKMRGLFYAIAFLTSVLALIPRLEGFDYFWGKYLWAEDGNVFINQAQEIGALAIISPYAGYLLVYPRFVTEISQLFDLLYQPAVLLLGWFLAYLILVHAIVRLVLIKGDLSISNLVGLIVLITLSSVQPNYGEVFFNITNSQWMLGAALCLYALVDSFIIFQRKIIKSIFLLFLATTGPFSIILTPVLMLKYFVQKNWLGHKHIFIPVFLGALIQLTMLLLSERISSGSLNKNIFDWLFPFIRILLFGADGYAVFLASLIIWIIIIYLFFEKVSRDGSIDVSLQTSGFMLILAFMIIFAGLFSHKQYPGAIVALGGGNRYSWIPYVLILASSFILSYERKIISGLMTLLFLFVSIANFHKVSSPNIQFEGFVKKSRLEQTYIPIHPQSPAFPGWHIFSKYSSSKINSEINRIEVNVENLIFSEFGHVVKNNNLKMKSVGKNSFIVSNEKLTCPGKAHAALNIYLTRDKSGWMQVFWSGDNTFNKSKSLRRWYPEGRVRSEFAFPIADSGVKFRFDPLEGEGAVFIERVEFLCL